MSYYNKLENPMWIERREKVKERDRYRCVACDGSDILTVHHIKYKGEPWDVEQKWLQTLCWRCHIMLGEHPKAGLGYFKNSEGLGIIYYHCPNCGMHNKCELIDKGCHDKCGRCSYRFVSEHRDVSVYYFEFESWL